MAGVEDGESLSERQENELEILKAIFLDDVIDLRTKDAWKISRPPELQISLKPQESMNTTEIHAMIDLHVKCPTNYPEVVPELVLMNGKGLSNHLVADLQKLIVEKAKELVGEVMLYDICQTIQAFLHTNNKPPSKSFYEEMMTNIKKQEEKVAKDQLKQMELKKRKEEKQIQQIEDEIQKRKDEAKRRREEARQLERLSLSEPNTQPVPSFGASVTPILKDNEQRKRAASRPSPDTLLPQPHFPDPKGSPGRQERRRSPRSASPQQIRRTSTPLSQPEEDDSSGRSGECQQHRGTTVLVFTTKNKERSVHRGRCLAHSLSGSGGSSTVYAAMDAETGELLAVAEWIVRWRQTNRKLQLDERKEDEKVAAGYLKQVTTCETELHSLMKLQHPNLVHYFAMRYQQDTGRITINVLMEYIGGGDLSHHVCGGDALSMELLRLYTAQLLDVLAFLHNKAIVHREIRPSSLMIDNTGKLRLADYSLVKRLSELVTSAESELFIQKEGKLHMGPPTLGRGGKKCDIYQMGITLLSLAQGKQVDGIVPEIPTSLPPALHDFLTKCLIQDERHRWSAHQLLEHSFLNTPLLSSPQQHKNRSPAREQQNNGQDGDSSGSPPPPRGRHREDKQKDDDEEEDEGGGIPFIPASDSGSRLKNEFDILKWLGKGGFGDVIKVRNKLDGRLYAIKRIPLNPKSSIFKKKITREVKLLSRLNHENVVRYYNSWIETSEEAAPTDTSSTFTDSLSQQPSNSSSDPFGPPHPPPAPHPVLRHLNSLGLPASVDTPPPPARSSRLPNADSSIEWSVSRDVNEASSESSSSSSDDDEEEDDNDVFGASFLPHSDSEDDDGIVFETDGENYGEWTETDMSKTNDCKLTKQDSVIETTAVPKLQFLYIQMEFCEKSTLRNCIDAHLYEDMDRVWRLFREIIEGMLHIHDQGMIHRDLKPVNIFLDSNDHVKIGDFGLATTDIISKQQSSLLDMSLAPSTTFNLTPEVGHLRKCESMEEGQGSSLTGKVGTALYVSPEIMSSGTRTHYNQKVDIYSLGVILFEMCYRPLDTGMERVKVLTNLRKPSIELPDDFDELDMPNQAYIIRWLLNHDPAKRPTSQELLQTPYLPPPQLEEAELNEVLRSTIANPDSKLYKHMIHTICRQPVIPAMDFAYDTDLYKSMFSPSQCLTQHMVLDSLEMIFRKHRALKLHTPLLMPKSTIYESSDNYVCLMDHSGGLVGLPYDLRVPFARFVAKNHITQLKRYSVERVYRENKLYNSHPRELTACAFDIVSGSSAAMLVDAEVIHVVHEIVSEFSELQSRNYYLRINHSSLLQGVLTYCGVPEEKHALVYNILGDTKVEKQKKLQVQTRLCTLSLTDHCVMTLYKFIEMEGPFKQVASMLKTITKTKGVAGHLAKKGLHELEAILGHVDTLGCTLRPVLALGLVNHAHHFSGLMFQVVADIKRKKKICPDVLAAGGRYDVLVSQFRKPGSLALQQCAVGVSVSFDKLVASVAGEEQPVAGAVVDVLVCSLGHKPMLKDKLTVAKELWAAGIHCDVIHDSSMSLEEYCELCRKQGVSRLIILKDGDSMVRVRTLDREKTTDKKMTHSELVANLLPNMQKTDNNEGGSSSSSSSSSSNKNQAQPALIYDTGNQPSSLPPITFITLENKLTPKNKRQHETQIYTNVSEALAPISPKAKVEILGIQLTAQVLRTVAANLEINSDENVFNLSVGIIVEKHQRFRKYLTKIFDHIHEMKFEKSVSVFVLYSTSEDVFRILL